MNFSLNTIDLVIIAASVVLVVMAGVLASRNQEKSARGYFLASGRMPWYIIGAAFVSTSVSSEQIVGTIGQAYKTGMGVANWEWISLPVVTLNLVFFIPIYLRNKITTVPDLLKRRFGPLCGDIYSWVMLVAYVLVFMVTVLYSGTLAFTSLTGWNFYLVLWLTVILVGLYAIKGGLASVMWTDALQCLMLVGGGVILFFTALAKTPGGWAAMVQANPERFHLYHPPSDPHAPFLALICGVFGLFIFYNASNQVMVQRVLGARSTWDGLAGIIFSGFINLVRPLVTCFLGFVVYYWVYHMKVAPPLENPDSAFPFVLQHMAPSWGLRGIVLAGFLAAVMSTISALANSTATVFSLDVYKKLLNRQADDMKLVRTGKWASFAAMLIAALIAPVVARWGVFPYFQTGVTYLATPLISVIILGILWKRANYSGAVVGLIGGFLIQMVVAVGAPRMGFNVHWLYLGFVAQVLTMALVAVVSLLTPPPPEDHWRPFTWSRRMLLDLDQGHRRRWYQSLLLWYGLYACIWIYLYWRFW